MRQEDRGRPSDATPHPVRPEDWPVLFTDRLQAGDLEGLLDLYDEQACFVAPSGETLIGRESIRPVLAKLLDAKTVLRCEVVRVTICGDLSVLYTDFQGTTIGSSNAPVAMRSSAIEVLRQEESGRWKLVIGDPHGRD